MSTSIKSPYFIAKTVLFVSVVIGVYMHFGVLHLLSILLISDYISDLNRLSH